MIAVIIALNYISGNKTFTNVESYSCYKNERFGFSVKIPDYLIPMNEPLPFGMRLQTMYKNGSEYLDLDFSENDGGYSTIEEIYRAHIDGFKNSVAVLVKSKLEKNCIEYEYISSNNIYSENIYNHVKIHFTPDNDYIELRISYPALIRTVENKKFLTRIKSVEEIIGSIKIDSALKIDKNKLHWKNMIWNVYEHKETGDYFYWYEKDKMEAVVKVQTEEPGTYIFNNFKVLSDNKLIAKGYDENDGNIEIIFKDKETMIIKSDMNTYSSGKIDGEYKKAY